LKLTRKEREKLRKNQEIIEASIKVFSEKGFYEATMHDIANAVEMGVGTLYQYFKNKDDLYYNAILYKLNEFDNFYEEKLHGKNSFLEILSTIITAWVEYFGTNNDFFAIVFSEWINVKKTFARKLKQRLTNEFIEKYDEIIKLIEKGKQAGEIKDSVNIDILSSMIFGAIQNIIHMGAMKKETITPAMVAENITSILSSGILNVK
jgi:TetR/AcrR family fatty acid metabolism transcriptional regulator